jgi:hypothetical protein
MGEPITYKGFYEGYHVEVVDFGLQDEGGVRKKQKPAVRRAQLWRRSDARKNGPEAVT